jgi:hypothetical protein
MKGSKRDGDILGAIDLCGVLDTDQLMELFFCFPSGKRKCQQRMKSLYDRKLVKRTRLSLDTPAIYYTGKFPGQMHHSLALSWAYVWMMKQQGEKILTWETEQLKEFGLRVDALCSTYIPMTKEIRWYCIELDRGSVSRHKFDKVAIYDNLYLREGVVGSQLMQRLSHPQRFPRVMIVTDSVKQKQKIQEYIEKSKTKVRYEVHLISSLSRSPSYSLSRSLLCSF